MGIVVQKFGGTSVATESARLSLLNHVIIAQLQGNDVVLVVSAMGRKGEPYATDTISSLLESINTQLHPAKQDFILSCGEIIACTLIAHFLDTNGIEAEALTGFQAGILTTDDFNNSDIINIDTTNIQKYINRGKIPVIAGFQGITWDGKITTLGRGGSDTTAVELGGFLKSEVVDIFTDVPGVAFVDPRVYPSAEYISQISYDDMYKLASHGAKVIHPRAVVAADKFHIPVRVRGTNSDGDGTLISEKPTKNDRKIIGIALDSQSQNITSAYILFEKKFKSFIIEEIAKAISNKTINALDAVYSKDNIAILMESTHIAANIRAIHDFI
jgi:aspartate kinase